MIVKGHESGNQKTRKMISRKQRRKDKQHINIDWQYRRSRKRKVKSIIENSPKRSSVTLGELFPEIFGGVYVETNKEREEIAKYCD